MSRQTPANQCKKSLRWPRVAAIGIVVAAGLYGVWQRDRPQEQHRPSVVTAPNGAARPGPVDHSGSPVAAPAVTAAPAAPPALLTIIPQQTIRDQRGRVVFRGNVDLERTLERIERGRRLEFSHDGITFENRERRLPRQPPEYYHEYVHPTPGVGGPGPQRIVVGRDGETYYTPDHYRTFRRLDKPTDGKRQATNIKSQTNSNRQNGPMIQTTDAQP